MSQVITNAGEALFAQKAQANEQLDIDTFIFAYVPGQDSQAPVDRNEGLPPAAQRVHTQPVQQVGRINNNTVVFSTVLNSLTGPFEFNWVGLYSSVNNTLVAISHVKSVNKTITELGNAGNTLNRNFAIEYSGISDITGITVAPETWQLDFSARLAGMDALTQNLAMDMNGRDWFIGDGFKVEPTANDDEFRVIAGVGYVHGMRLELEQDYVFSVQSYPQNVYVDVWFGGDADGKWSVKSNLYASEQGEIDYTDNYGIHHIVVIIAVINEYNDVDDLREMPDVDVNIKNAVESEKLKLADRESKELIAGIQAKELRKADALTGDGGSMVDRLKGLSHVNQTYMRKINNGDTEFLTFGGSVNSKAFDYTMKIDSDGMLLIRGARIGDRKLAAVKVVATNITGSFVLSDTNFTGSYARSTGDYFDIEFEGVGLYFNHYKDSRGGVWEFVIDGGEPIKVSTWSSSSEQGVSTLVAQDLDNGVHTCRATYIGKDPLNPPSDGTNGRGWFDYTTEGDIETCSAIIDGTFPVLKRNTSNAVISPISIPEFAINVSPSTGEPGRWIPEHGGYSGACRNIERKIIIDGEAYTGDIDQFDLIPKLISSLIITQEYTAFNSHDSWGLYPFWKGYITHKFEGAECTVTHHIEFISDDYSAVGYFGMFPTNAKWCDTLITSKGQVLNIEDVARTRNLDPASSYAFVSTESGDAATCEFSSINEILQLNIKDIKDDSIFLEEREDSVAKVYCKGLSKENLGAGSSVRYQTKFFVSNSTAITGL